MDYINFHQCINHFPHHHVRYRSCRRVDLPFPPSWRPGRRAADNGPQDDAHVDQLCQIWVSLFHPLFCLSQPVHFMWHFFYCCITTATTTTTVSTTALPYFYPHIPHTLVLYNLLNLTLLYTYPPHCILIHTLSYLTIPHFTPFFSPFLKPSSHPQEPHTPRPHLRWRVGGGGGGVEAVHHRQTQLHVGTGWFHSWGRLHHSLELPSQPNFTGKLREIMREKKEGIKWG